jgi:hypothetical protein
MWLVAGRHQDSAAAVVASFSIAPEKPRLGRNLQRPVLALTTAMLARGAVEPP